MLALGACGTLPARDPTPRPASPTEVRNLVTVRGPNGPVTERAEGRALAAVQAEGRGDLTALHLGMLAAKGEVDLYRGNATRLLLDGPATFSAMKAAIEAARTRVMLEMYIFEDAGIAEEMGALLRRKAAAGVNVALIYDSVGSIGSDPQFFAALAQGGVAVCAFNPINPLKRPGYWSINHRDHRKILVVDSDIAYTGGINVSRVYTSGSNSGSSFGSGGSGGRNAAARDGEPPDSGWRDTQIEMRGPVVAAFATAFRETWDSQGCKGDLSPSPAPLKPTSGDRIVKVLTSEPRDPENRIYTTLLSAVDTAQRSIHLTMAYFAPGEDMVRALCDAARRGVDVHLVLPGRSDFSLILHAGRSYYEQLLTAGVRIHEMDHAVMHAKTAIIDGVLSTVGSSNMDWRSFVSNNEINVIVLGEDFGRELEAVFQRDLAVSRAIEPDAWARRGIKQRFLEQVGRAAERLL